VEAMFKEGENVGHVPSTMFCFYFDCKLLLVSPHCHALQGVTRGMSVVCLMMILMWWITFQQTCWSGVMLIR
jgi:hypothetical protein